MNPCLRPYVQRKVCTDAELEIARKVASSHWHPHHGGRIPVAEFAMIRIYYAITDADGDRLELSTWTRGSSEKCAVAHWKHDNPAIAADFIRSEVIVAAGKRRVIYDNALPIGPRIAVRDEALAHAAVGL